MGPWVEMGLARLPALWGWVHLQALCVLIDFTHTIPHQDKGHCRGWRGREHKG